MIHLLGARVVGPLEPYVVDYCDYLDRLGYTAWTRRVHMTLAAHVSR